MAIVGSRGRLWIAGYLLLASLAVPSAARAQTETVEYYATDAIGSIRVVFDANGNELARADYLPFGEELSTSGDVPAERFTGQKRDAEAGLDYFNARMFQPRTGRFTAADPVYSGLFAPQAWNRYAYANNSPVSFADPLGLYWQCVPRSYQRTIKVNTDSSGTAGTRNEITLFVHEENCIEFGTGATESPHFPPPPTRPTNPPGGGRGGGGDGGGDGGGGAGGTGGEDPRSAAPDDDPSRSGKHRCFPWSWSVNFSAGLFVGRSISFSIDFDGTRLAGATLTTSVTVGFPPSWASAGAGPILHYRPPASGKNFDISIGPYSHSFGNKGAIRDLQSQGLSLGAGTPWPQALFSRTDQSSFGDWSGCQ